MIRSFFFALKRIFVSRSSVIVLVLIPIILVAVAVANEYTSDETVTNVGIYFENEDEHFYLDKFLEENPEIVELASEEELNIQVSSGKLDCGFIVRDGITEQLEKGYLEKCIGVVTTERTTLAPIYTHKITSNLLKTLVPYVCTKLLAKNTDFETDYDKLYDMVYEKYTTSVSEEGVAFEYRQIDGKPAIKAESTLYSSIVKGILAIMLTAFSISSAGLISSLGAISERITPKKTLGFVIAPFSAVYMLCAFVSSGVGIFLADRISPLGIDAWRFALYILMYLCALLGVSLIVSVFKASAAVSAALPLIMTVTIVICPVFTDLRTAYPALDKVFTAFPPCWLFGLFENSTMYAVLSAALLAVGISAVTISTARKT